MIFQKTRQSVLVVFTVLLCIPLSLNAKTSDLQDSDGDGLSDQYEEAIGSEPYLSDTDGDGVPDGIEVGSNQKRPLDSDQDGRLDVLDFDDDNDGLPTYLESKVDTDKDGLKDYLDQDSDNDGLSDGDEAGVTRQDKNQDGVDDAFDMNREGATDKNGDGIDDNLTLPDSNNNGIADYLDASFPKNTDKMVESNSNKQPLALAANNERSDDKKKVSKQKTSDKKRIVTKPTKPVINRYTDTDNDGLLDSQELIFGTNPLKRDSDGDTVSDAIEIGMDINAPQDSDHDGIIDALDEDDDNDGILTKLEDLNKDGSAINEDTDNDGVPNYLDGNDDGDSKLTREEGGTKDTDNDGILDYLDKNDGRQDKKAVMANNDLSVPNEPEIIVLFDGNQESFLNEKIELESVDDLVKITINDAIENKSIEPVKPKPIDKMVSGKTPVIIKTNLPSTVKKQKSVLASWDLF